MKITEVSIDAELESFLPVLSLEERAELKAQIKRDGFTDPIIVWLHHGVLIDGHNRYRIWQELGSDPDNCPEIIEKKFADKAAVMEWMYKRQDGRRNWTAAQKSMTALKMKPAIEERVQKNTPGRPKKESVTNSSPNSERSKTRTELAKIAGVSEDTIRKTETVLKEGTPEIKAAMASGEISANKAFVETKKISGGTKFDPSELEDGPDRVKPPKNGSVVQPAYDEKKIDKPLGVIRRELDERLKAYPATDRLFRAARYALCQFCDAVEAWRSGK